MTEINDLGVGSDECRPTPSGKAAAAASIRRVPARPGHGGGGGD